MTTFVKLTSDPEKKVKFAENQIFSTQKDPKLLRYTQLSYPREKLKENFRNRPPMGSEMLEICQRTHSYKMIAQDWL